MSACVPGGPITSVTFQNAPRRCLEFSFSSAASPVAHSTPACHQGLLMLPHTRTSVGAIRHNFSFPVSLFFGAATTRQRRPLLQLEGSSYGCDVLVVVRMGVGCLTCEVQSSPRKSLKKKITSSLYESTKTVECNKWVHNEK